jgi:uncharacterized membrane protein YqaE (UPF0057 family)
VAFATQVAFALLMLRWFSPQEVGEFSVISQIGFFWMTLALAQSNLSVLANHHLPAPFAARQAWRTSTLRGLMLLPVAAFAVWFSQLAMWPALVWALLLAACQTAWMLAQSFTLRAGSAWQQALARVLPPATAAIAALTTTLLGADLGWDGPVLLLAGLLGYAVGAAWLVPAFRARGQHNIEVPHAPEDATRAQSSDPRSAPLRMAHTLADAMLATAIIVVWQRLYGAEETGWMSALLRVLGFVPAVVHMAWAQVALAQGANTSQAAFARPGWLGLGAFACVAALGAACAAALQLGGLSPKWSGVLNYIGPLVLWQGSACMSASFSHRPFQTQAAQQYSWACMGLTLVQAMVLLSPTVLPAPISATSLVSSFALVSAVGLLTLTAWMARLK